MTAPTQLPAYIQLRLQENGVFGELDAGIRSATDRARSQFESAFNDINASITRALSVARNSAGSLDFGVDELRAAQAAHEARAIAAREAAVAVRAAAEAEGDYSERARLTIRAAEALAVEEREAAAAARARADAVQQLQVQLDKQKSSTDAVIQSTRRGTNEQQNVINSTRASRTAFVQLGQQMQDVVVQAQLGTNAFIIFSQQVPQAAFALSGLADSANKTQARIGAVATFLAGPWGAAIFAATAVLGPFIYELLASGDAAEEATGKTYDFADGLNVLELSAKSASEAMQQLVQETRAAIAVQGDFLKAKAQVAAQSVVDLEGRITQRNAQIAGLESRSSVFDFLTKDDLGISDRRQIAALKAQNEADRQALALARQAATNSEIAASQSSVLDRLDPARAANSDYERDVGVLNQRREATRNDPIGAQSDGIYLSEAQYEAEFERLTKLKEARVEAARADERSGGRSGGRANRSAEIAAARASRETDRLSRVSDSAAESIARINEQFDDQPRLVDKSAQAVRKLQTIIDELNDPKNANTPRRLELIAEAQEAQSVAARAVATEISRYRDDNERNLDLLTLQARGLEEQAEIMAEINRLDEQLGLSKRAETLQEQKRDLEDILAFETSTADERAKAEAALTETNAELDKTVKLQDDVNDAAADRVRQEFAIQQQIQRTNALMQAQLNVLDTAREGLTNLLSGRSTNLFGDLKQALADLQGARLFDQIFGDVFDQLEAEFRKRSPLGKATDRLKTEVDGAAVSTDKLAEATETAAKRILQATAPMSANDNGGAAGIIGGDPVTGEGGEIVVTAKPGQPTEIDSLSISDMADKMAKAIVDPMLAGMDEIFGTAFMQGLSGVLTGALSGYLQAGKVGGVIGGLKGIAGALGADGLESIFGDALGGASRGTQTDALLDLLGIKSSRTGAQIGGAVGAVAGSFIPGIGTVIGSIIGSVLGGVLGGLFSGPKTARANITGVDQVDIAGADTKNYGVAEKLADSVLEGLDFIADQLDASIGNFNTTIGVRDGEFRVNTDGTSLKIAEGAVSYGEDGEAAVKAAILDAILDGAIQGLRAGSERLLKEGKDLDKALQDVLTFEGVFKRLKAYKDPIGSALDELNNEFEDLIDLFQRAGASSAEFAQLEELYDIERANAIKEATEQVVGALRSLLNDLTIGDSGLSLRTREQNALQAYLPLAERVKAGDVTAYDDYAAAARELLDIERQLYGSTQVYFDRLAEVTQLTASRINAEGNVVPITDADNPFNELGQVKSSIDTQTETLGAKLDAINTNLIKLATGTTGTATPTASTAYVSNF